MKGAVVLLGGSELSRAGKIAEHAQHRRQSVLLLFADLVLRMSARQLELSEINTREIRISDTGIYLNPRGKEKYSSLQTIKKG